MLLVELWRRTGGGSGIAPTMVQTGVVQEFAGDTAPDGYLMCDGATYLVADYPNLFAVIGYKFGGVGASFAVPDRRDRFAVGAGGAIAPNVGDTGGAVSASVVIAQANLPSYALAVTDPGHNHTQNAHTHTQDSHNHTQDAHTHTQNSHNHTQDAHTHTQNSHTHTQNSHTHTQNSHEHNLASGDTLTTGSLNNGDYLARSRTTTGDLDYQLTGSTTIAAPTRGLTETVTAVNQSTTATNQSTTATNQNTTATNNATTATNQNTTATNQAATATNQNTTATNNSNTTGITVDSGGSDTPIDVPTLPPFIGMNFIIKT